jgi:hypothetical protein
MIIAPWTSGDQPLLARDVEVHAAVIRLGDLGSDGAFDER